MLLNPQQRLEALSEAKAISDAKVSSLEQLVRSLRADLKTSKRKEKEHQQQFQVLKQQGVSKVSSLEKQCSDLRRELKGAESRCLALKVDTLR